MIHDDDDNSLDFSWIEFVGTTLLGYTVRDVGRMTFGRWFRLYKHFQNYHDIKVKGISYKELREQQAKSDEWLD